MSQLKQMSHLDNIPSTPDPHPQILYRLIHHAVLFAPTTGVGQLLKNGIRSSAKIRARNGISVLVTGAAGFVEQDKRFWREVEFSLLKVISTTVALLKKLFDVVSFTHVMHLAAQAGVRYAMQNPSSYVHSNIAGLVSLLEVCKNANPQPAIVWASSSSVYGLNTKIPHEKSTGSGGKKKGPAQLRVFNLGNTSPVPVTDLVSILERLLKVKAKRNIMKLPRNGDVPFTHANISLAQRELGYKPTTDLQTGLKKFVRWYISYYSGGKKASG
ncbi:UDP-glucuronate 4-epimerase 4 [Melia azedarach]|uniref:UDP-glucuronate 4-epimerase 4 n=1 Tax=Melia azedarach TaxID=155640 RepID=A0ACC1YX16_MELAZ|nr:UDP-glucuronate 4-epimerase 4 [Melia azedarach]